MPIYEKCPREVEVMARQILELHETHHPLIDEQVSIGFVFAYADKDDAGSPIGNALSKGGVRALGICRKINDRDRAQGRPDAEISLDGDHWASIDDAERIALLDHELHHIQVTPGDRNYLKRPKIKLRKHDAEFGWFACIAARNGKASIERQQARVLMESHGQYFWPDIHGLITAGDIFRPKPSAASEVEQSALSKIAKKGAKP